MKLLVPALLLFVLSATGTGIWGQVPNDSTPKVFSRSLSTRSVQNDLSARRGMVLSDPFSVRKYVEKQVSPDGQLLALEIAEWVRGAASPIGYSLNNNLRTELWVVSRNGNKRAKLTPEQPVQLSQWDPVWSPNSQRLAFFSNEARGNAFLKVWDRKTGQVRQLTSLGADLFANLSQTEFRWNRHHVLWLDDTHLLIMLFPRGSHSALFGGHSGGDLIAQQGIRAAAEGSKPTAIVASSPPTASRAQDFPQAKLTIIDTKTGFSRGLLDIPVWGDGFRSIVVSPNQEWAAIVAPIPPGAIDPHSMISDHDLRWAKLGLVSLANHEAQIRWVEGLQPADVLTPKITWRTDDTSFAIVGRQLAIDKSNYLGLVGVPSVEWRSVGVLDERRLGADQHMRIHKIAWLPDGRIAVKADHNKSTPDGPDYAWWVVSGGNATRMTREEQDVLNLEGAPNKTDAVKLEISKAGRLYEKDAGGRETTIFPDLNPQLAEIEAPRSMDLQYKSSGGEILHANLLLPHGYVEGRSYPTVVWVYGGDLYSGNEDPSDYEPFLNLSVLTGHGYAVLEPSMPLPPEGIPGDPMLHLNDGVDPAVDRAVELGLADPDRLALLGHSYGGYSVFGLLTQTKRYRAAIALMGISDLTSFYCEFFPSHRYSNVETAANEGPWWVESTQGRMGVPIWVDPDRYIRNSPVFAADKITTPLLIFSGDLDPISSTQSEAMFTVLHRQGKRAEYVRYLGEGHSLESPANMLDSWQRIFSWLDTYLRPKPGE